MGGRASRKAEYEASGAMSMRMMGAGNFVTKMQSWRAVVVNTTQLILGLLLCQCHHIVPSASINNLSELAGRSGQQQVLFADRSVGGDWTRIHRSRQGGGRGMYMYRNRAMGPLCDLPGSGVREPH